MNGLRTVMATAVLSIALAACASSGGQSRLAALFGGSDNSEFDPDMFRQQAFCPPVQVRLGAETVRVVARGGSSEDSNSLRYQANIGGTARECARLDAATLNVRLGVEGRVVAGPQGTPGQVTLPIRVAAVRQGDDTVLFSQLFSVLVNLQGVPLNADFAQVFNQISFPATESERDIIILVGFDNG